MASSEQKPQDCEGTEFCSLWRGVLISKILFYRNIHSGDQLARPTLIAVFCLKRCS